ncbi:MAG: helix-turn-helix domain-containing protein [Ferruginibacter sp.]
MNLDTSENKLFQIASDFINKTNHPVFLTGKAGTGKTTFLKYIKENTLKTSVIVAPTGVAAMNAGGTTIHSFFQLPFTPFVSLMNTRNEGNTNAKHDLITHLRMTSERKEILQQLDLLIIDEISMVRADVLDAIDLVLRHVRNSATPFGGIQVLYIGDMYQLPPVIKPEEWNLLKGFYSAPFFFCSHVIAIQTPVCIELKKVYRQRDEQFIDILNKVRNNEMDQQGYELLHSRFMMLPPQDNIITLTTHNAKADAINKAALERIDQKTSAFAATIEGTFYESAFPAEENLILKPGARVMFLKNDLESRRYFNGKIGVVHKMEEDSIWIECENEKTQTVIELKRDVWRNIKYTLNHHGRIEEEELGSFRQFPIRLAWAITIHKSQGLTFEEVIIDAANAFAPGQVYVALSRCTSIEGLYLTSPISFQSLQSDPRIVEFSALQQEKEVQTCLLNETTKIFHHQLLFSVFDTNDLDHEINFFNNWIIHQPQAGDNIKTWVSEFCERWKKTSSHFRVFLAQLKQIIKNNQEDNTHLHDRIMAAAAYFLLSCGEALKAIQNTGFHSDSRVFALDAENKLRIIYEKFVRRIYFLEGCKNGFDAESFLKHKYNFKKTFFKPGIYSGHSTDSVKSSHPDLYVQLKTMRDQICVDLNLPVYLVCTTRAIEDMTVTLPTTLHALGNISGFGKIKLKQFGKKFISIITEYCNTNHIEASENHLPVNLRKTTKSVKENTKKITFEKFTSGKSIDEIAAERNLSTSTIERHLTLYVKEGNISLDSLVKPDIIHTIRATRKKAKGETLSGLKLLLPDISYSDIKFFLASEK